MPRWLPFVLDAVLVVVFAALGRGSHREAVDAAGVALTAWPFLIGLGAGWFATLMVPNLRRLGLGRVRAGIPVWLITVMVGMGVRVLTGRTAHWSFIMVSLITLGILLLGWRAIAAVVTARRAR